MRENVNSYTYSGIVVRGSGRARSLGFPSVNIPLHDPKVSGIYAARVYIKEGDAPSMAAVYADQERKLLEAHLMDFSDDLYDMNIKIELRKKIRESTQFDNDAALRLAIAEDVAKVREYFKN